MAIGVVLRELLDQLFETRPTEVVPEVYGSHPRVRRVVLNHKLDFGSAIAKIDQVILKEVKGVHLQPTRRGGGG